MFDDMYYELVDDDEQSRAERLEARHWHALGVHLRDVIGR